MKPKLWDGDNAVGEAKERHLQTLDTPYLTASAEGFMARKRGQFSEVTGPKPGKKLALDGWFSTSDAAQEQVHIYSSPDYRTNFRRRGTISQEAEAILPGSAVFADGRGRAVTIIASGEWELSGVHYERTFDAARMALSGRSFTSLFHFVIQAGWSPAELAEVALVIGAWQWILSSGRKFCRSGFEHYVDDRGVLRTRSIFQWFRHEAGAWNDAGTSLLPLVDYEDCGIAWACWLSPTRMVAVVAHRPEEALSLHVSDDFGDTWTDGVIIDGVFPGVTNRYAEPETEDALHIAYPAETWEQTRARFLAQPEIKERLRRTSNEVLIDAVSKSSVVITSRPYWNGTKWVISLALVATDPVVVVTRAETFDAPLLFEGDALGMNADVSLLAIGFGSWAADFYRPDDDPHKPLRRVVTFDFGQTYEDIPFDNDTGFVQNWHVRKPYKSEEDVFEILAPGTRETDDGDARVLFRTLDMVSFSEVATIAKPDAVVTAYDFSRVAHIGTPDKPGPITPHAPWTTDSTQAEPAWWSE